MEVCIDSPNKLQKYKNTKKYKKYISTKVLITQSFFELLTSDFAWKFIWTVEPNDKVQKYKNTKVQSTKQTSTKTQKNAKNVKNTKKCKNVKNVKSIKNT